MDGGSSNSNRSQRRSGERCGDYVPQPDSVCLHTATMLSEGAREKTRSGKRLEQEKEKEDRERNKCRGWTLAKQERDARRRESETDCEKEKERRRNNR